VNTETLDGMLDMLVADKISPSLLERLVNRAVSEPRVQVEAIENRRIAEPEQPMQQADAQEPAAAAPQNGLGGLFRRLFGGNRQHHNEEAQHAPEAPQAVQEQPAQVAAAPQHEESMPHIEVQSFLTQLEARKVIKSAAKSRYR